MRRKKQTKKAKEERARLEAWKARLEAKDAALFALEHSAEEVHTRAILDDWQATEAKRLQLRREQTQLLQRRARMKTRYQKVCIRRLDPFSDSNEPAGIVAFVRTYHNLEVWEGAETWDSGSEDEDDRDDAPSYGPLSAATAHSIHSWLPGMSEDSPDAAHSDSGKAPVEIVCRDGTLAAEHDAGP